MNLLAIGNNSTAQVETRSVRHLGTRQSLRDEVSLAPEVPPQPPEAHQPVLNRPISVRYPKVGD